MQYFRYSTMHSSLALVIGLFGMTAYAENAPLAPQDRSPETYAKATADVKVDSFDNLSTELP